jgi:exodeoxyribonuclease-1
MSQTSFYFYDLETSGFSPKTARIMQFAGQRVDINLEPIDEPDNVFIKLTDDVLPEPEAVLLTGITPQKTIAEGITEAEFLAYFEKHIVLPHTIFVGFNNIRFDDEFLRFTRYRNFYDAYDWAWKNGCSRWDILDITRLTRALRPDGISWPYDKGKPSNKLALLTAVNKLDHTNAHDALADVEATIAVAKLIKTKEPKLFQYLLTMRLKENVKKLAEKHQPFLYTSGSYPSVFQKTALVINLGNHPKKQGVFVYDLRIDPTPFIAMNVTELSNRWRQRQDDETKRFPIKTLQYNRCPAVAPYTVIKDNTVLHASLGLDMSKIKKHQDLLTKHPDFYQKLVNATIRLDRKYQTSLVADEQAVDAMLYDGFFDNKDQTQMSVIRALHKDEIRGFVPDFQDVRLALLYPLYKARNFRQYMTNEEQERWEAYKTTKLTSGGLKSPASQYFEKLQTIQLAHAHTNDEQYLLEELKLYGESILPSEV